MGRIKPVATKVVGDRLLKEYPGLFTESFDENKKALGKVVDVNSKKMRNVLAGYITTEVKNMKKTGM